MAKNIHPVFKFQGTIGGNTYVKSKANKGEGYVRAQRGTIKPAVCNSVLEENSKRTSSLNRAAKPVHDAMKQLAGGFKQSNLWQQMLKRMRSASTSTLLDLYASLEGMEINSAYPLERLVPGTKVMVRWEGAYLVARFTIPNQPMFARQLKVEAYVYELSAIWMDEEGRVCGTDRVENEGTLVLEQAGVCEFLIGMPEGARYYLLCLGLRVGKEGDDVCKGMRVVEVGAILPMLPILPILPFTQISKSEERYSGSP